MKFGMGKKGGDVRGGESATKTNKGLIWLAWLLSTAGFAILLAGVASMQQACGGSGLGGGGTGLGSTLLAAGGGSVGYLGPVPCSHLFQYAWWITFLHFFAWLLVLVYLASNVVHKSRGAMIGILAVAAVLLMDTANTFLLYNYIPGVSGTFLARTRTTVAGACIAAAADLILILLIGWDSTRRTDTSRHEYEGAHVTAGAGTLPGVATTTTTAGTVPVQVPV